MDIKNGDYTTPNKLIIQVESLHKIAKYNYDCVIIDECETVLSLFSSSTLVHVQESWDVLTNCIKMCKWCVLADAFILQRSLDFLVGLCGDEKITMIVNDKCYLQGRKCIQISQDNFNEHLIDNLNNGKRIVNISGSKADLQALYREIKYRCPEKITKMYDCNTDKTDLKNVNEAWKNHDFIGYTPVIQTGVSYMDRPFDLCLRKSQVE